MDCSGSVLELSSHTSVFLGVVSPTKVRVGEKEILHHTDMAHAHECTYFTLERNKDQMNSLLIMAYCLGVL